MDIPPSYEEYHVNCPTRIEPDSGLTEYEEFWLKNVLQDGKKEHCSICLDNHRPYPIVRRWIHKVIAFERLYSWGGLTHAAVIQINNVIYIQWRKLFSAMRLYYRDPWRATHEVQRAISIRGANFQAIEDPGQTFIELKRRCCKYLDRTLFSHRIDVKFVNNRLLLKVQSYRGLSDISLEDLRLYLPTCMHCQRSTPILTQFKQAITEVQVGKRSSNTVFRCHKCPMEYTTMVVPRAPCHFPNSRLSKSTPQHLQDSPNRSVVSWNRDMVVVFCQWIDFGPCDSTFQKVKDRLDLGRQKHCNFRLARTIYSDTETPICTLFEGERVWPYTFKKPKITLVAEMKSPDA